MSICSKAQYRQVAAHLKNSQLLQAQNYIDSIVFLPKYQNHTEAWYARGIVYEALALSADTSLQISKDDALSMCARSLEKVIQCTEKKEYIDTMQLHVAQVTKPILYAQTDSMIYKKKYDKYISYLDLISALDPKDTFIINKKIKYYLANENYPEAHANYENLLALHIRSSDLYKNLIIINKDKLKDYDRAAAYCDSAAFMYKNDTQYLWYKIDIAFRKGKHKDIVPVLDSLIRLQDTHAVTYRLNKALVLLQNDTTATTGIQLLDSLQMPEARKILGMYYYTKANDAAIILNNISYDKYLKQGIEAELYIYQHYKKAMFYLENIYFVNYDTDIKPVLVNIYRNLKLNSKIKKLDKT
ncbi:MAG: hypothetical protein NW207_10090 [Cytophagales bacterium]|nr:hypothetical protein [Cytophagales bacterium]